MVWQRRTWYRNGLIRIIDTKILQLGLQVELEIQMPGRLFVNINLSGFLLREWPFKCTIQDNKNSPLGPRPLADYILLTKLISLCQQGCMGLWGSFKQSMQ